jgi:hypothetical protein
MNLSRNISFILILHIAASQYLGEPYTLNLTVTAGGGGTVLRALPMPSLFRDVCESDSSERTKVTDDEIKESRDLSFVLNLSQIIVSLVAEHPLRRELFAIYVDRFEAMYEKKCLPAETDLNIFRDVTYLNAKVRIRQKIRDPFVNQSTRMYRLMTCRSIILPKPRFFPFYFTQ